jgi:hypothetical protein
MQPDGMDGARHLRERPPVWPRHEGEWDDTEPKAWSREPEIYEEAGTLELYPGATVMDDLFDADDEVACTRVLARYTVVRVLLLSAAGWLGGARLRVERRIAAEHLTLLPAHDWERQALERLTALCIETPEPAVITAATVAAEAAAKRGHAMGAFALYRAGYELARRRAWWAEAAAAGRGIATLARLNEAHYSVRLWERRIRVLERRIAREQARESDGDRRRV